MLGLRKGIRFTLAKSSTVNRKISAGKYLILLLILTLLLGCAPKKVEKRRPTVEPFKYEVLETRAEAKDTVKSRNQAQLPVMLEQNGAEIVDLLTRYSNEAFLKPGTLAASKTSRLEQFFSSELRQRMTEDWQALSLGEEAADIRRATKGEGKMARLWIYYDEGPRPAVSAVDFSLQINYELKDGGKAKLTSSGSFVLEPDEGGRWKVTGYRTKLDLRSREKNRAWDVKAGKSLSLSR